jgi:uncharacterized protein YyaL (SSP411 family)
VREVALVGDWEGVRDLTAVVRSELRPRLVLAAGPGGGVASEIPLLAGREPVDGRAAAYVCQSFTCQQPVTDPEELRRLLG